jgi:hypothetical protein
MSRSAASELLLRALAISRDIAALADAGDAAATVSLNAERGELLRAVRRAHAHLSREERAIVAEIAALNNSALGVLEHRLRIKARELDMATVGRRAVAAYAATG